MTISQGTCCRRSGAAAAARSFSSHASCASSIPAMQPMQCSAMQCVTSVGTVAAGLGRLVWTAPQPPSRSAFSGQRTGHICTGTTVRLGLGVGPRLQGHHTNYTGTGPAFRSIAAMCTRPMSTLKYADVPATRSNPIRPIALRVHAEPRRAEPSRATPRHAEPRRTDRVGLTAQMLTHSRCRCVGADGADVPRCRCVPVQMWTQSRCRRARPGRPEGVAPTSEAPSSVVLERRCLHETVHCGMRDAGHDITPKWQRNRARNRA